MDAWRPVRRPAECWRHYRGAERSAEKFFFAQHVFAYQWFAAIRGTPRGHRADFFQRQRLIMQTYTEGEVFSRRAGCVVSGTSPPRGELRSAAAGRRRTLFAEHVDVYQ